MISFEKGPPRGSFSDRLSAKLKNEELCSENVANLATFLQHFINKRRLVRIELLVSLLFHLAEYF